MKKYNLDCNVFIIPNSMTKKSRFLLSSFVDRLEKISSLNGIQDEDPEVVQTWFVGGNSDNMTDHGFKLPDGTRINNGVLLHYIPYKLLCGHKEGDTVSYIVPIGDDVVELNCTLKQLDYRYRNFGRFEECLDYVYRNSRH